MQISAPRSPPSSRSRVIGKCVAERPTVDPSLFRLSVHGIRGAGTVRAAGFSPGGRQRNPERRRSSKRVGLVRNSSRRGSENECRAVFLPRAKSRNSKLIGYRVFCVEWIRWTSETVATWVRAVATPVVFFALGPLGKARELTVKCSPDHVKRL